MFDGRYQDLYHKRIKGIIDFYSHKFIYYKKILDLGCGHGDMGGSLQRLGADITCVDVRQEHLKIAAKKYQGIKTIKADLDAEWPFQGKHFDIILDLDLICHLRDFENHLKRVCASTTHLVLETAVCDSNDPHKSVLLKENQNLYDLSSNGVSCRPSAAAIERVLIECGMNFKRQDDAKYNSNSYVYNWIPKNNDECDINKRRIWFAVKSDSPIKLSSSAISSKSIEKRTLQHQNNLGLSSETQNIVNNTVSKPQFHIYSGNEDVAFSIKHNANFISDSYNAPITFDLKGIISTTSYSTSSWLSKIIPFFPQIKINSDNIINSNKTNQSPNLLLGQLGSLKPCSRIWLEEFINKPFTETDKTILSQATHIFTPSIPNAQYLRILYPNIKITTVGKTWPALNSNIELNLPKPYTLVIHRNKDFTDMIVRQWKSGQPPLVLLGARGRFPEHVIPLPNYLKYEEIFNILKNASCVVDLPENNHYVSGILDLAFIIGVPIVTSNHWMSIAQPPASFVKSHLLNNRLIPMEDGIFIAIQDALNKSKKQSFDVSSYNLQLYANMKIMLEEI